MGSRGFTFDEKTHAYSRNGICIPSVTRILDHAGLVNFDMVKKDILDRKATIGTLVHLAASYYDMGTLDWDSLDRFTRGRTEAWANFRADSGFVPRIIEQRYLAEINGMTYGLTADREGLIGKDEAVIDIKCTADIAPWVAIQTAGYALGVPGNASSLTLFMRRRRMAVQLFETGKYKKVEFTDRHDANVFISALHISHWKLSKGVKIIPIEDA